MQNYLKQIRRLQQKKYRSTADLFIAEGTTLVLDLLKGQYPMEVLFCTALFHKQHHNSIPPNLKVFNLTKSELARVSRLTSNQGAIALAPKPKLPPLPNLSTYLLFENIRDPRNLGSIIRIACWYGFEALICSLQSVDSYNPKTLAVSMAAFTKIPIYYTDLESFIKFRKQNYQVIGTFLQGQNLHKHHFKAKNILVFGNETHGISSKLSKYIDLKLTIPRYGPTQSLNVAITTAIFCDHLRR